MQLEAFELYWKRIKNIFLKKQDLKDKLELDKEIKVGTLTILRRQSRKNLDGVFFFASMNKKF